MKRNQFFLRVLVKSTTQESEGAAFVIEHPFTTGNLYEFDDVDIIPVSLVAQKLETNLSSASSDIIETPAGIICETNDFIEMGWRPGIMFVDFDVVEDGVGMFSIENLTLNGVAKSLADQGSVKFALSKFVIAAYAIGIQYKDGPFIDSGSGLVQEGFAWIEKTDTLVHTNIKARNHYSNRFKDQQAFGRTALAPEPTTSLPDIKFMKVFACVHSPTEPSTSECCDKRMYSEMLVAASVLVASNNPMSPALIGNLVNVIDSDLSTASVVAALENMRQMGSVSNLVGNVIDKVSANNEVVVSSRGQGLAIREGGVSDDK